jgi:hypothetical protein
LTNDRFENSSSAYDFDGVDDYIEIQLNQSLSYTYSAWVNFNDVSEEYQAVIQHKDNCSRGGGPLLGIQNNQLRIVIHNCGQCSPNTCPTQVDAANLYQFNPNQWYNLIITASQATNDFVIYLNGAQVYSFDSPESFQQYGVQPLSLGKWHDSPDLYFTHAEKDDIGVWNRALTPQEITALYTASSTNNNATSNTTTNVPGAISYQAVARDAQGMPLADANLQVRFKLIADSLSGTAEYVETHTLTTNSLGLFTTAFGAGTPVNNTFGNINWSAGNKFLQVQIDTGNGWMDMGTQQLLSTPYSMHSATSGAIKNPGLPVFADNAAALAGGLVAGDMYRTASGDLKIVY